MQKFLMECVRKCLSKSGKTICHTFAVLPDCYREEDLTNMMCSAADL